MSNTTENQNEYLRELFRELDAKMDMDVEKAVLEILEPEYDPLKKYIQGFNDHKGFIFGNIPMDKKKLMYSIVCPDEHTGASYACLWRKIQANLNSSKPQEIESALNSEATVKESENDDEEVCVVCLDNKKTHAFNPCGHMCVCKTCADIIIQSDSNCPMCRISVTNSLKIYA